MNGSVVLAFNSPAADPLYSRWAHLEWAYRSGGIDSRGDARERLREFVAYASHSRFRRASSQLSELIARYLGAHPAEALRRAGSNTLYANCAVRSSALDRDLPKSWKSNSNTAHTAYELEA